MENSIPAYHWLWGDGVITSSPIWSVMVDGYVVIFKPDAETFSIPVPVDELTVD